MIDSALLKRLLIVAAALLSVSAGAALLLGATPALAGGLLLGYVLGATPFATWGWIAARGFSGRSRWLAVALLVAKLALYSGALYLLVFRPVVSPVGVFAGIGATTLIVIIGSLTASPRAKEAAKC